MRLPLITVRVVSIIIKSHKWLLNLVGVLPEKKDTRVTTLERLCI